MVRKSRDGSTADLRGEARVSLRAGPPPGAGLASRSRLPSLAVPTTSPAKEVGRKRPLCASPLTSRPGGDIHPPPRAKARRHQTWREAYGASGALAGCAGLVSLAWLGG